MLANAQVVYGQENTLTTQHLFNPMYINPAAAGLDGKLSISSFFKSKWSDVKGAPDAFLFSVNSALPREQRANIGMIGGRQSAGPLSTITTYTNFSYKLTLSSKSHLLLGGSLGILQYKYDSSVLHPGVIEDPHVLSKENSMTIPDARIGALFYTDNGLSLGLSADNLISQFMDYTTDPEIIMPKKSINVYLTAAYLVHLSNQFQLKPEITLNASLDQNPFFTQGTIKFIMTQVLNAGISFRTILQNNNSQYDMGAATAMFIEILAIKNLEIAYSFDLGMGGSSLNQGSHEVYLKYKFNWPNILETANE